MNKNINVQFELLSPLSHYSDEILGTMKLQRTMKLKVDNKFIDVPVYSGNAFRGHLRRIAMRDMIQRIGIADEGISEKMYHLLFTGGALTSSTRFEEIEQNKIIADLIIPIRLLGSAIGNRILSGKMKSSVFYPISAETEKYTGIQSSISIYEQLQENFYTRRDDAKINLQELIHSSEDKKAAPTQMKYEEQGLSAGAKLIGTINIENANELDISCFHSIMKKWEEVPYIGGRSSVGHGKVNITYDEMPSEDIYYQFLEDNKKEIVEKIREIEGVLK